MDNIKGEGMNRLKYIIFIGLILSGCDDVDISKYPEYIQSCYNSIIYDEANCTKSNKSTLKYCECLYGFKDNLTHGIYNICAKKTSFTPLTQCKIQAIKNDLIGIAPIIGSSEAKNTVFLWFDYSCPYSRRVYKELEKVLQERKDVRVVLQNYSIHSILSDIPAKAVIAAKFQASEKAILLNNLLMAKEYFQTEDLKNRELLPNIITTNVMELAKEAGLDTRRLSKDMEDNLIKQELKHVRELAQYFKIQGTPFLIINENEFPGVISYEQIIDNLK